MNTVKGAGYETVWQVGGRWLALSAMMVFIACGRPESRITNPRLEVRAPESGETPTGPLTIVSVELAPLSDEDAGPNDWVACVGGTMAWDGDKVEACRDRGRAYVDPRRDEITLVVTAENAWLARVRIGGELVRPAHVTEAPFVGGVARLVVGLRPIYAHVMADRVAAETPLTLKVEVEHQGGVAMGEIALMSARVARLLEGARGLGVTFPDEHTASGDAVVSIHLGPQPELLPPNPSVPLHQVTRVVLDVGEPHVILPCPLPGTNLTTAAIRERRSVRAVELVAFERRSGEVVGTATVEPPEPPCGDAAPSTRDVRSEVTRALDQLAPPTEPVLSPARPARDQTPLLALADSLGVGVSPPPDLGATLGLTPTVRPAGPGLRLLGEGPLGALADESGVVLELRVEGRPALDILKIKKLENPYFALIEQPLEVALDALGRPAVSGSDHHTWTIDRGPREYYLELRCDRGPNGPCRALRLGFVTGTDPHDGGDVPGAEHRDTHRHPQDQGGHGHDHAPKRPAPPETQP